MGYTYQTLLLDFRDGEWSGSDKVYEGAAGGGLSDAAQKTKFETCGAVIQEMNSNCMCQGENFTQPEVIFCLKIPHRVAPAKNVTFKRMDFGRIPGNHKNARDFFPYLVSDLRKGENNLLRVHSSYPPPSPSFPQN